MATTPTPWEIAPAPHIGTIIDPNDYLGEGDPHTHRLGFAGVVAMCGGCVAGSPTENAALIVRAVNNHQSLVDACRLAWDTLVTMTSVEFRLGADKPARDKLAAALADLDN